VGVGGDDDLFSEGFDGVEGVEELFLGCAFAREEVDVVDDEEVEVADLAAEGVELVVAEGEEEFIGEFFAGEVDPVFCGVMVEEAFAEALEEVCFAEAAGAVDEEGVVLDAGEFGDVEGGVVGELVGGTDDEGCQVVSEAGE